MEAINKREVWNKGKLVSQKPPVKPKDIFAIRIHLQNAPAVRDLAIFNLTIARASSAAAILSACTFTTSRMGSSFSRLSPGSW